MSRGDIRLGTLMDQRVQDRADRLRLRGLAASVIGAIVAGAGSPTIGFVLIVGGFWRVIEGCRDMGEAIGSEVSWNWTRIRSRTSRRFP